MAGRIAPWLERIDAYTPRSAERVGLGLDLDREPFPKDGNASPPLVGADSRIIICELETYTWERGIEFLILQHQPTSIHQSFLSI